jgi:hypothetical protein
LLGIFGDNLRADSGRRNVKGYGTSENLLSDYGVIESEFGVNLDFFWDLNENVSGLLGFFWVFLGIPETMEFVDKTESSESRKAEGNEYPKSRTEGRTERKGFARM